MQQMAEDGSHPLGGPLQGSRPATSNLPSALSGSARKPGEGAADNANIRA